MKNQSNDEEKVGVGVGLEVEIGTETMKLKSKCLKKCKNKQLIKQACKKPSDLLRWL